METITGRNSAALDNRFFSVSVQATTSGCLAINCGIQNINDHHAVSEQAQTTIVSSVIRRAGPRNSSRMEGADVEAALALCHSSGSGTARRIQNTSSAGATPIRKTQRGWNGAMIQVV